LVIWKKFSGLLTLRNARRKIMAITEQSFCKITLFLIRDWDSFQIAMRGCLASAGNFMPGNAAQGGQR
jgi:hypothetical protein